MKVDGACQCGFITYETEIDPDSVRICHCTECQTFSGSAFRIATSVAEEDFKLLSGKPKIHIKTAESGNLREQVFCPECGTHIYATSIGDGPRNFGIRIATLHQRNELTPTRQIRYRSAQPWVKDIGSIPHIDTQ